MTRPIRLPQIPQAEKETSELKTQFTQKEIDNFPDEVKEILPLCEKIEVTP